MTKKKNPHFLDRIVRIIDESKTFQGTGTLLDDPGWVLTCGHVFKSLNIGDGVSLKKTLPWAIQTSDGACHDIEYLDEKFDDHCLFDYALFKSKCARSFAVPLMARNNVEEHRSASMYGFSGAAKLLLRVNGRIIGPTSLYQAGCTQQLLQLFWQNPGSYTGFSGAPIFVDEPHIGVLLAGIQSSELEQVHAQVGTPLAAILQRSTIFSSTIATLSNNAYRRKGFRLESTHDLSLQTGAELDLAADTVLSRLRQSMPSLAGQISKRHFASRLRNRIADGKKVVALVVCTRRPRRYAERTQLATHFGKQRWRQNMLEVMTEEELRQLRAYREYVKVFLFF